MVLDSGQLTASTHRRTELNERWINEQLYSTPSTEALAMMRKDPKIFTDVSSNRVTLRSS